MTTSLPHLEPANLWTHFSALNAVPRPSKREERVIQFMLDFAASHCLFAEKDAVGNVLVRKPATPGMEHRETVVMQAHLDMVHQKNNDTDFDFESQGIDMFLDGDWVKARGTTLGADNGIGVAAIMAVLSTGTLVHPPIEALFTIDEETGMTGAKGLRGGWLQGRILLNLDTENDAEIDIGCAGGIDVTATRRYRTLPAPAGCEQFVLTVKGLQGGHSGMDIHKGLGNANKVMARLLEMLHLGVGLHLCRIQGGSLRNAIPRECQAGFYIAKEHVQQCRTLLESEMAYVKSDFSITDPGLDITLESASSADSVMHPDDQLQILRVLYAAHNGVYRMSPAISGLVETSNNVAVVRIGDGQLSIGCLTRSAVESSKMDLANTLRAVFELGGCEVVFSGDYPGWAPNPDSPVLQLLTSLYQQKFKHAPEVVACHAGLECGILGKNYPGMDMISFGPTILGAHSPDERVSVSSVAKFWDFLVDILKAIPERRA